MKKEDAKAVRTVMEMNIDEVVECDCVI